MQILSNQNCAHVNCTDVPTERSSTLRYLLPFGNQHSLASAVAEYCSACRLKDRCRCCGKSESCSSCQLQCETNPIHIGKQLDPADRWQDMILCVHMSFSITNFRQSLVWTSTIVLTSAHILSYHYGQVFFPPAHTREHSCCNKHVLGICTCQPEKV